MEVAYKVREVEEFCVWEDRDAFFSFFFEQYVSNILIRVCVRMRTTLAGSTKTNVYESSVCVFEEEEE